MTDPTNEKKPRAAAGGASADCVTFPVESPLTGTYDAETGRLLLETTVCRSTGKRRLLHLKLDFSPQATHGFVMLLKAVEDQVGVVLGEPGARHFEH